MSKNTYTTFIKHYITHRPLFFSFIRPREAYFFDSFKSLTKSPILDLGSGDGFFAEMTWGKKKIDVGLDLQSSRAQEAEGKGIYKKIVYYDGTKIPFPDNHFQTVVANCVLEHIPNIDKTLSEIYRVLKPGGHFLTGVMADNWEKYMFGSKIAGKWYQNWMKKMQQHENLLSEKEWTKKFKKPGFKIIEKIGYISPENAQYLDIFHYVSLPSLLTYTLFKKWDLFPQQTPGLVDFIVKKTQLPENTDKASAIFYVVQK